jgi:Trk K+ transport system NAD-binding subunit
MDVVRMLGDRDYVLPILTNDLIARVVAQTSRQSGLSVVYTELMNFGGDEIYFADASGMAGKTFGDLLFSSSTSTILGLRKHDGRLLMNPPMETIIETGDQVFALAEDDDKLQIEWPDSLPIAQELIRSAHHAQAPAPEKCLILGWNRSGTTIVRELDNYVSRGSQVTVVSDLYNLDKQIRQQAGKLTSQKVVVEEGDTTDRSLIEKLGAADYDHVIVLAYSHLAPQEADAKTLVTLLHLRDIAEKDDTPFSIVSEMLDLRNRELAEAAKVDDFIVSEHLVSLMTTQLSENRELFDIFNDIFDPEGSEIYLKPIGNYVVTGEPVNFYTLLESARCRGETAIGYRLMSEANDSSKAYGVHTNPPKAETVIFSARDELVDIANA